MKKVKLGSIVRMRANGKFGIVKYLGKKGYWCANHCATSKDRYCKNSDPWTERIVIDFLGTTCGMYLPLDIVYEVICE